MSDTNSEISISETMTTRERMSRRGICVIIPTYNNEATLRGVLQDVMTYCADVIVVNDGSTDGTQAILSDIPGITTLTYAKNRGKGYALKYGLMEAKALGFAYAITMDADGQHYAKEIPAFMDANIKHPGTIVMGNRNLSGADRTAGSSFANKFSNFWLFVQTGHWLSDTQTGYRLYPLRKLYGLGFVTSRYEAELELLVFALWRGVEIKSIPIDVFYPPREQRVSHFRPYADFLRISVLNTVLCFLAVVYALPLFCLRTIIRSLQVLYSLLFFLFFSLLIITPLAWLRVKVGKMTDEKRLWLHRVIYHAANVVMIRHGIPGVRFTHRLSEASCFDEPKIIICNHQSHLDLMCQLLFSPKVVFLTNDWVYNNFFYGFLIRNAEFVPVRDGVEELLPQLRGLCERGYSIAVYPEGTRSQDCRIRRFHVGAFYLAERMGIGMLPMVLYGTGHVLTKQELRLRKGNIHIEVEAPITRMELDSMGDIRKQASALHKWYVEKYEEIRDKVDRDA